MKKNTKYNKVSPQTQDEAMKMAKATQRPGQTKEQTKLIAQGIEKGINLYKKQQKGKSRELNKKMHKVTQQLSAPDREDKELIQQDATKLPVLPWILLVISWVCFLVYEFLV